jgi:glycosyltransferase involved in cell wall biosynthesis
VIGVQEMINHGSDGLLVKAQCAYAMADAIEILLHNSTYAQILAQQGRQRALAEFSLDRMAQAYEQLFSDLQQTALPALPEQLLLEN